jgi:hypothetical protein
MDTRGRTMQHGPLRPPLIKERWVKLGLPGTLSAVAFALAFYTATGTTHAQQTLHTRNVVLVTIDGLRWQELFGGADSALIRDRRFPPYTADAVARSGRP